jgi:hypothetical protein
MAAALAGVFPTQALAQEVPLALRPGEVLLQVDAQGEARNRPDVMSISAGVVTNGPSAAAAMAANRLEADRMLKAVTAAGVVPSDVQTSDLSVEPVFQENESGRVNRSEILGYVAKNTVDLRLRDLTRAPEIIDALFASGANNVRGPTFSLSDSKPAERQARQNAVAAAREEADTYAVALGMKVARVIRVSERGDFEYEGGQSIVVTGSRIPRTRIEPGELKTRIHVWIDYALLPS